MTRRTFTARQYAKAHIIQRLPVVWVQPKKLAGDCRVSRRTLRLALDELEKENRVRVIWAGQHNHKLLRVERNNGEENV